MAYITIEQLDEWHECDDCGPSHAEGARIYINGQLAIDLTPHAHCYASKNYDSDAIITKLLEHLGHTVEIKYV